MPFTVFPIGVSHFVRVLLPLLFARDRTALIYSWSMAKPIGPWSLLLISVACMPRTFYLVTFSHTPTRPYRAHTQTALKMLAHQVSHGVRGGPISTIYRGRPANDEAQKILVKNAIWAATMTMSLLAQRPNEDGRLRRALFSAASLAKRHPHNRTDWSTTCSEGKVMTAHTHAQKRTDACACAHTRRHAQPSIRKVCLHTKAGFPGPAC